MPTSTRTRNVDPTLARLRATLGTLERDGRADEAEQVRHELTEAKFYAAIRRAVEAAPPLSDQQRLAVTVLLGGAA